MVSTRLILLFSLLLILSPLRAIEVRGLHDASVPVPDHSEAAREVALAQGIGEVLTRLTGESDPVADPVLAPLMGEAARYLQQYRYEPDPAGEGLQLRLHFDPVALADALRTVGRSIWGEERPLTLVWLAREEHGKRQLVAASDGGPEIEALAAAGRRRGLPLRLPLLDLAERSRISVADVWGGFYEPLIGASERYGAKAVLIGRVFPVLGGAWRGRWELRVDGEARNWEATGESEAAVIRVGVEGAAEVLAARYAQSAVAMGDTLELRIGDVTTLEGYVRVLAYLRSLSGVADAQPVQVESDALVCRLVIKAAPSQVTGLIALGDTLERIVPGGGGVHSLPEYRLLP